EERVGGQVVQAEAAEPAFLEATEKILSRFAREGESVHNDGQIVTVPIADRSALSHAVRALDDAGSAVDDLALRRPSLDEVFLSLTGHLAEEQPQEEDTNERSRR